MKITSKRQAAIVLFAALFCLTLNAQESTIDFNLSDYQLPYLKRQTLELDFDLYGSSSRGSQSRLFAQGEGNQELTDKTLYFSSSLNPVYNFYLNTPRLQIIQSTRPGIHWVSNSSGYRSEYHYLSNNDYYDGTDTRSSILNPYLDYTGEFREFVIDKFFIEQDVSAYYESNQNKSYTNYLDSADVSVQDQTFNDSEGHASFTGSLLLGWGRIEQVEDARLAVYILDDLKKAGRIAREVTPEDIITLAKTISRVQNERSFDYREKAIREMETIDSLLQDLRLVSTEDMIYYTHLKDNWNYANGPVRESGFMLAGGLTVNYASFSLHEDHTFNYFDPDSSAHIDNKYLDQKTGVGVILRQRYEKPLNLYWQFSLENTSGLFRNFESETNMDLLIDSTNSSDQKYFEVRDDLFLELGYYPNSRTKVSLYSNSSIYNIRYTGDDLYLRNSFTLSSQAGIYLYYYVSPQLRFTFQSYMMTRTDNRKFRDPDNNREYSIDGSITARITYKFL